MTVSRLYGAHAIIVVGGCLLAPGLTTSVRAQDVPVDVPVEPVACDWADWANSPGGVKTQFEYGEVRAVWDCTNEKPVIDYIWRGFGFEGWQSSGPNNGFDLGCDTRFPVGRALAASYLLGYSNSNAPSCNVKQDNVLDWAICWTASNIDELLTACLQTRDALATTSTELFDTQTLIHPHGMYEQEIERLSSTIFHEARHWDCGHNADDDECKRHGSCDDTWADGCPWPSNGGGSNRYQVSWLSWFANRSIRGTGFLKEDAVLRANSILEKGYAHDPCFRLAPDGSVSDTKPPGC